MRVARIKVLSVVGLALLLSIASYELVQRYVAEQTSKEIKQHKEQFVEVLVSAKSIVAGDIIEAFALAKRRFPQSLVQDSWLRPEDAQLIIGLAAARFIEKGEPLSPDTLVPATQKTFSQSLAKDQLAVTSMISKPQLHNGLIEIGDIVTLVSGSFNTNAQSLVLTNIKVIALDYYNQPNQMAMINHDYLPSTITFAFSAKQALIFEQMRRQSFAVWLQHPEAQVPLPQPEHSVVIHYLAIDKEVNDALAF